MSKRKHAEIEDRIEKISDRAVRIKASRLQVKVSHGIKTLKDALNLARGFERQKMGRRQKQASSEPHTLLRLREEVIVLKELEMAKTASHYLRKQMIKTKRIRESDAFVVLFGEDAKGQAPENKATANVLGRLFKARPVVDAMPGIMQGIKQVLGLDSSDKGSGDNSRPGQKAVPAPKLRDDDAAVNAVDDFEGFSDEAPTTKARAGTESGSELDDSELEEYNGMLAVSSEESDQNDYPNGLDPMEISDDEGQGHDRDGLVPQPSTDMSSYGVPHKTQRLDKPVDRASSTNFLPSLSMGGYYSGSDSDDLEDEFEPRGPALPKDRKNRRGQRARQQLAELKFGKDAKHLQTKQRQKTTDTRGSGWDAKRGAVDRSRYDPKQRRFGKAGFARSKGPTGANGDAMVGDRRKVVKPGAKKNEGPLHPSWEAAKKRKQESGKVSYAGKRIIFD